MLIVGILWFLLCFVAAGYGSSKSLGGVLTFFVSLIFSPLIGFIVAALSGEKQVICPNCEFKYSEKVYYCPRCGKDREGYDANQNKFRFEAGENPQGSEKKNYAIHIGIALLIVFAALAYMYINRVQ